jgi:hypothetical protein
VLERFEASLRLELCAPGFRPRIVDDVREDARVVLEDELTLDLVLGAAVTMPPPAGRLFVLLAASSDAPELPRCAAGSPRGTDGWLQLDARGTARTTLPHTGPWTVLWAVRGDTDAPLVQVPPVQAQVELRPGPAHQVLELWPVPEELEAARRRSLEDRDG